MSADLKELFRTLRISEVLVVGLDDTGSFTDFNVVSEDPSVNGEGGMYGDQILALCSALLDEEGVTDVEVGLFTSCSVKIQYDGAKFNITCERSYQVSEEGQPTMIHTQEISF